MDALRLAARGAGPAVGGGVGRWRTRRGWPLRMSHRVTSPLMLPDARMEAVWDRAADVTAVRAACWGVGGTRGGGCGGVLRGGEGPAGWGAKRMVGDGGEGGDIMKRSRWVGEGEGMAWAVCRDKGGGGGEDR